MTPDRKTVSAVMQQGTGTGLLIVFLIYFSSVSPRLLYLFSFASQTETFVMKATVWETKQ